MLASYFKIGTFKEKYLFSRQHVDVTIKIVLVSWNIRVYSNFGTPVSKKWIQTYTPILIFILYVSKKSCAKISLN